jgi:hypothetical protein
MPTTLPKEGSIPFKTVVDVLENEIAALDHDTPLVRAVRAAESRLNFRLYRFQLFALYLLFNIHGLKLLLQVTCGAGKSLIYLTYAQHSTLPDGGKGVVIVLDPTAELAKDQVRSRLLNVRRICELFIAHICCICALCLASSMMKSAPQVEKAGVRFPGLRLVALTGDSEPQHFTRAENGDYDVGMSSIELIYCHDIKH